MSWLLRESGFCADMNESPVGDIISINAFFSFVSGSARRALWSQHTGFIWNAQLVISRLLSSAVQHEWRELWRGQVGTHCLFLLTLIPHFCLTSDILLLRWNSSQTAVRGFKSLSLHESCDLIYSSYTFLLADGVFTQHIQHYTAKHDKTSLITISSGSARPLFVLYCD